MQEISLSELNQKINDVQDYHSTSYWRNSFTTEPDVKEQAIFYSKNLSEDKSTVKAALQLIDSRGSLKLIMFGQDKETFVVSFYDKVLAFNEFVRITS